MKYRPITDIASDIIQSCAGKWDSILPRYMGDAGVAITKGSQISCPACNHKKLFMTKSDVASRGAATCARASCHKHYGNAIALVAAHSNRTFTDVVIEMADDLGIARELNPSDGPAPKPKLRVVEAPKPAPPQPRNWARHTLNHIERTKLHLTDEGAAMAITYFRSRGLNIEFLLSNSWLPDVCWFVPSLRFRYRHENNESVLIREEELYLPAIVFAVLGHDMAIVTYHAVYLDPETGQKAKLFDDQSVIDGKPKSIAKRTIPPVFEGEIKERGSVIPFGKVVNGKLGVGEGMETMLAVTEEWMNGWSCKDAGGLRKFVVPDDVDELHIFGDYDDSGTGQEAMFDLYLKVRHERPDVRVYMHLPPETVLAETGGEADFLDVMLWVRKHASGNGEVVNA